MQFVERVRDLWSWLPAFRAVAETEHLPSAAKALDVVPSSLSRSIKLLEESVGAALFDHGGKALVLNEAGRRMLDAVRESMRLIDDAVHFARGDEMHGMVSVAVTCDVAPSVLAEACAALHRQHPGLEVAMRIVSDDEGSGLLLRGELDVAVVARLPSDHRVAVTELVTWQRSAYVRREAAAALRDGERARCIVIGSRHHPLDDGWPGDVPRQIMMWAADERVAPDLCVSTGLVMVAADRAVPPYSDRLAKLPGLRIRPQTLYAAHRSALGTHPRTDALVSALRASLG